MDTKTENREIKNNKYIEIPYKVGDQVLVLGKECVVTNIIYDEAEIQIKVKSNDGKLMRMSPFASEAVIKKIEENPQTESTPSCPMSEDDAPSSCVDSSENNSVSEEELPNTVEPQPISSEIIVESNNQEDFSIPEMDTLEFSLDTSRNVLCYSEYFSKDQLKLILYLENRSEKPFGKFTIRINTSSEILLGLDSWTISGSLEGADSNKSYFSDSQKFTLNPHLFRGLTERTKETITATLIGPNNETVKTAVATVEIEPMDYWNGSIEAIPFFIERNNPDIISLQKNVSQALQSITDTNALDAYQSKDPNRVLCQCAAIYSTLQSQKLIYMEPKQSDNVFGQRIRLVSEVLREKTATCLDSTILFCALAESIGLHTLICIMEGHAFPGVWLEGDRIFDALIHDDPSDIVSLSETRNQKICVVESTMMTTVPSTSFEEACRVAREKAVSTRNVIILDVHFARTIGISPIPRKVVTQTGEIVFEDESEIEHEKNRPVDVINYNPGELNAVDNTPKTRVDTWERNLISLSTRSPLLNERIRNTSILILHHQIEELEDALVNGESFSLVPNPIPNLEFSLSNDLQLQDCSSIFVKMGKDKKLCTGENENNLEKKLKQINRKSQNELSETGVNPLFLAIGHIEWVDSKSSTSYCAPILLYPVNLTRKTRREFLLSLRDGEEPQLNYSIFEKMSKEFGIRLSLDYDNLPRDEQGLDIRRILQIVKHDIEREPRWRVGESCLLGLFSFDQYILWNDIHKHSDQLLKNKVVYSLANGEKSLFNTELPQINDMDALHETVPVSCDESQMRAVKAAGEGLSFILQGPPGTGKSQTITAMIVDALAKGKKVLFVAEKMAALQVVYRNLCKVKCNEYLLEMHSTKLTKSRLIEQLERALDRQSNYEHRDFINEKNIEEMNSTLNEYVEVLHKKNHCGLSLCELIDRYEEYKGLEYSAMQFCDISDVTFDDLNNCISDLEELSRSLSRFRPVSESEFRFFDFSSLSDEKLRAIATELSFLTETGALVEENILDASQIMGIQNDVVFDFSVLEKIKTMIQLVEEINKEGIPKNYFLYPSKDIDETVDSIEKYETAYSSYLNKLDKSLNPAILKNDIPALLREWDSIKTGFLKGKKRREFVSKISSYSSTPLDENEIEPCLRRLNQIGYETENVDRCLKAIPTDFREEAEKNPDRVINTLLSLKEIKEHISKVIYSITKKTSNEKQDTELLFRCQEKVRELKDCYQNIKEVNESWNRLMALLEPDDEILSYSIDDTFALMKQWKDNINSFQHWARCNALREKISQKPYAIPYLNRIIKGDDYKAVIDQMTASFIHTQIESIVHQNPILERYDTDGFLSLINQLEELDKKHREFVVDNIHNKLDSLINERTKNDFQLSRLRYFIYSKGKKRSIRSLFSECSELITNLCPCLLMSPMSVSQFFEAGNQVFDLVVMDEASQIQTCKAIGAIARGKELIVVGDSKQMPPTSFFTKTTDSDDEYYSGNEVTSDLESILIDCAQINMPQLRLNWHYRSKSESLIHFSNLHYYNHKLKTYPSTDSMVSKVRLVKVKGFYQSDSKEPNPSEAEAIILEIIKRLKDPVLCKQSIGVITFNEKQQNCYDVTFCQ